MSKSSTQIKIGKVKIIAIFSLVIRLMQFSYDTMFDLSNMEEEYKEHIAVCLKEAEERKRF